MSFAVRMADGHLAVFSPVALTEDVKTHVARMGQVAYIIAPDIEHHIFLDVWHHAYPTAKLIGPADLKLKREKMGSPLPWSYLFHKNLRPSVNPEFDHEFNYTFVSSHPNQEIVAVHKPTKTLIEADLLFNLPATEQYSKSGIDPTSGYWTRAFITFTNTQGSAFWQRGLQWTIIPIHDKHSFDKNIREINGWDFDRLIPCHGNVIEHDGKAVFRKVFAWSLSARARAQMESLQELLPSGLS